MTARLVLTVFCAGMAILSSASRTDALDRVTTARFVPAPEMELPAYLETATDPSFGTTFVRMTVPESAMGAGIVCKRAYCTHRYSSAQAWNADQSLLVIVNGCNGLCFFDGQTYAPLFRRQRAGECEWHPVDPKLMICTSEQRISLWSPRDNVDTPVFESNAYRQLQFGPYKGNPSWDGHRMVVRALDNDDALVAFAYDLVERRKFPDIKLAEVPGKNSYCGISPLGAYIFCQQSLGDFSDQAFIFDVEGKPVQSWTEHHRPGHGDMTVDSDGSEVYVGISKSPPDKYQVIKRRLKDGLVTALAPPGEIQHASTRAIRRPGWVFLSYAGVVGLPPQRRASFIQEVIALRIDGSGEIRRIAQTRNAPDNYWAETHASPSPDGSQIIWSSNWGQVGGPVFEFVSRLNWSDRD